MIQRFKRAPGIMDGNVSLDMRYPIRLLNDVRQLVCQESSSSPGIR
jgi:hypothetical protein